MTSFLQMEMCKFSWLLLRCVQHRKSLFGSGQPQKSVCKKIKKQVHTILVPIITQ